jgi:hypothetical protein
MIPLLLAAAALTAPMPHPFDAPASPLLKAPPSAPAIQLLKPDLLKDLKGRDCSEFAVKTAGPNGGKAQKLADLPPGLMEHAVLRSIHGCPVREIMFAGGTYYLGVPDTGIEPVAPAADR